MWMETFYWALTTSQGSGASHPLIISVYGGGDLSSPKSLPWPSRPVRAVTLRSTLPVATLSFPPLQPQGLCRHAALILKPYPRYSLGSSAHITYTSPPPRSLPQPPTSHNSLSLYLVTLCFFSVPITVWNITSLFAYFLSPFSWGFV